MGTAPQNPPDPLVNFGPQNTNTQNSSPIVQQADQADEIAIIQAEDLTLPAIKGVLGGLPVAERTSEYFAVIKEAGDTSPEIIGQTQFKVIYLCDSQLNVSKPSSDSVALSNIVQNFERQKYAQVRVDEGTVLNQQLGGIHQITAVGSIEPIGGTQIGTGPLSYVTTMSFVPEGQLGAAPGVEIAGYYYWLNKTAGFQNRKFSYRTSGNYDTASVPSGYVTWNMETGDSALFEASASGVDNGFRVYYDNQLGLTTGSAVTASSQSPLYEWTDNIFNGIQIKTGSAQGGTRIRVNAGVGLNIATSSVNDLFASAVYSNQVADGKSANAAYYNFSTILKLKVYRDVGGLGSNIELIDTKTKAINTFNDSFINSANQLDSGRVQTFANTNTPEDNSWFHWAPDQAAFPSIITDYFDVEDNDRIFCRLELPLESTASTYPSPIVSESYFTASLGKHGDRAIYRKYGFFGGHLIINQETPQGDAFINGISGVTASYYTTQSDGINVSQSVWNGTGSYWVGYNYVSSSTEGIGTWITASTPLTTFYGGEYIQSNPGAESYNEYNAEGSVTSSLTYINADGRSTKKTWENFGFNPIRLPFVPQAGDFIRFEYSKTKKFQITKVASIGNTLKLKLDGTVPSSTVLDNFMIYRIVENGQYIILDVEKNNEAGVDQTFTGVITPQYPSKGLGEKGDTLIYELKQANIIET